MTDLPYKKERGNGAVLYDRTRPLTIFTILSNELRVEPPASGHYTSTRSRSSFPALKNGTRLAGIDTASPDLGFRPTRGGR